MGGIALGLVMAAASGAAAAQPLGWSFSSTGVGSCEVHITGCDTTHPPVYTQQGLQYGYNMDATSSASDPAWGAAHGSANLTGALPMPELHSDVTGLPSGAGVPYSWNYSQVQGVIGLTAINAVSFDLHDIIGALDFSQSGTGVGIVSASLAILDYQAGDVAIGNTYYAQDASYGFANDCSSPGALAIGETGSIYTRGANLTSTVAPTICGASTVNLAAGDTILLWARLQTFETAFDTTNASFRVELAPGLSQAVVQQLTPNLTPIAGVPEPTTWAMIILGLGATGSILRRRRATAFA
jgi:hypothetical protein